jgi:hypothetical protein
MVCHIVCKRLKRRPGKLRYIVFLINLLMLSNSLFLRSLKLMRIPKVKMCQRKRLRGVPPLLQ